MLGQHGVVLPCPREAKYQGEMHAIRRDRYKNALSVKATEAEQYMADALAQSLTPRNILCHREIRAQDQFLGRIQNRIRKKVNRDCH